MGHVHRIAASLLVLGSIGGCRSVFGLDDPQPGDPAGTGDAAGDSPIDTPAQCNAVNLNCTSTTAAFQCGSRCWVGCSDTVSHSNAVTRCDQWGGELAPFVAMSDQDCFRQHIQPSGDAWTGLVQMTGATTTSANWSWNGDGFNPPFFNWASGQPNDGDGTEDGTEQCAQIRDTSNTWQDVPCGQTFSFACRGDD